jgi:hypothetical protein
MKNDLDIVTPAEAFRLLLRARYPKEPSFADEIISYDWFHPFYSPRLHPLKEGPAAAWRAYDDLREGVKAGSIRLQGVYKDGLPNLIALADQRDGELVIFGRDAGKLRFFKDGSLKIARVYDHVYCIKADVVQIAQPAPDIRSTSRRGAPTLYDWEEDFLFLRKILAPEKQGDPLDPEFAKDGWRSDADVGRAVAEHIAVDGREPDLKHVMRKIGPELEKWRSGA